MDFSQVFERFLFPTVITPGPGLPDPPTRKREAVKVPVEVAGARLVNRETKTWEWDIARARPANKPAEMTDLEAEELDRRKLRNMTWNMALKLARVQGLTIGEAAKAAKCSFSYAQKAFAALSAFDKK